MKNMDNKKEYRRLLTILQKSEGRTYEDIANEHMESAPEVCTKIDCCLYPKWY